MEKKYADRLQWQRVTEREFKINRMDSSIVTCLSIQKVREPLVVTYEAKHCIADNGYKWFQVFQDGISYTLTAVVNNRDEVVQFYYDLCLGMGFDEERQSPWYLDAYLDVVYLPSGDLFILDEDEFQAALVEEIITQDQAITIEAITNELINNLKNKSEPLMKIVEKSRGARCEK